MAVTGVVVLKQKVKQIERQVSPDKTGLAWSYGDGNYGCDGYNFKTRKAYEEYVKRRGYTRMVVVSWEW